MIPSTDSAANLEAAERYIDGLSSILDWSDLEKSLSPVARTLSKQPYNLSYKQAVPLLAKYAATRKQPNTIPAPNFMQGVWNNALAEPARTREANVVATDTAGNSKQLRNYELVDVPDGDSMKQTKVGVTCEAIQKNLQAHVGDWPIRVDGQLYVVHEGKPLWLAESNALFAWIDKQLATVKHSSLSWAKGDTMPTQSRFFEHLKQYAKPYAGIEGHPHEPQLSSYYYTCAEPISGDGTTLKEFLELFKPDTDVDRELIKAYLLTLIWGGHPGTRPAFLFVSSEDDVHKGRGTGKSTIAEKCAELVGGAMFFSPKDSITDIKARILSAEGMGKRVAIIDNVKSVRLSSADYESLITCKTVSGKRLYSGEGSRPNYLTYCFTYNQPAVSKDLAERCVIIRLGRPTYQGDWLKKLNDIIQSKRQALIGDAVSILRTVPARLARFSRWPDWESAIVGRLPNPEKIIETILDRRLEVDDEAREAIIVRNAFITALEAKNHKHAYDWVRLSSKQAAHVYNEATGERYQVSKASAAIKQLHIAGLRYVRTDGFTGFDWFGEKWTPEMEMRWFDDVAD